jgi:Protein of unknown function (DUF3800)
MLPCVEIEESHFVRLLQILLRNGGYVVALAQAQAYFDESGTHDGSPFICIAGYVFESNNSVLLNIEWRKMLNRYGLPHFRMSECAHREGVYSHLTRQECDDAAREAILLIKKYAAKGIAISLDPSAYPLLPPSNLWANPYSFLVGQVFFGVRDWADQTGFHGDVSYFFESGAEGWGFAAEAMEKMKKDQNLRRIFRFESYSSVDKAEATPVQCADLLAWHWFTHKKRLDRGDKIRQDFRSLVELKNIDVHHYGKEDIEKWLESMKTQAAL